jgi:hypothetical protein
LGEAAAAGAFIADDDGALIADVGADIADGSLPDLASIEVLVAALAASFACRLQR